MSEFGYVNKIDGRIITVHEEIYEKYRERIPDEIYRKHEGIERKFNLFYWVSLVGLIEYAGFKLVTRRFPWSRLTSTPLQTARNIFLIIALQFYGLVFHIKS